MNNTPNNTPEKCKRCDGTRWYVCSKSGTTHSKVCEVCCDHAGTAWKADDGKFYCIKGCGTEMPEPVVEKWESD